MKSPKAALVHRLRMARLIVAALAIACMGTQASSATKYPGSGTPRITIESDPRSAAKNQADCADCFPAVSVDIEINGKFESLMVSRYEVTWNDYLAAHEEADCPAPRNIDGKIIDLTIKDVHDNFPMTSLKPDEFGCYLTWIRRKTGKPFRLPSEAEWTAIARKASGLKALTIKNIPTGQAYLLGELHAEWKYTNKDPRDAVAQRLVQRVGQLKPDSLGLYDLFGNAAEAVSDPVKFLSYNIVDGNRPLVDQTIVKGGNRFSRPDFDVINDSAKYFSFANSYTVGFRLVYEKAQ